MYLLPKCTTPVASAYIPKSKTQIYFHVISCKIHKSFVAYYNMIMLLSLKPTRETNCGAHSVIKRTVLLLKRGVPWGVKFDKISVKGFQQKSTTIFQLSIFIFYSYLIIYNIILQCKYLHHNNCVGNASNLQ